MELGYVSYFMSFESHFHFYLFFYFRFSIFHADSIFSFCQLFHFQICLQNSYLHACAVCEILIFQKNKLRYFWFNQLVHLGAHVGPRCRLAIFSCMLACINFDFLLRCFDLFHVRLPFPLLAKCQHFFWEPLFLSYKLNGFCFSSEIDRIIPAAFDTANLTYWLLFHIAAVTLNSSFLSMKL